MPKYLIKLIDKDTGAECMKEYAGRDRCSAQDKAIKDDWMLAEPKAKRPTKAQQLEIETPKLESSPSWRDRFWNADDPAERVVVRGVCKAYCLILYYTAFATILFAVLALCVYAISLAARA